MKKRADLYRLAMNQAGVEDRFGHEYRPLDALARLSFDFRRLRVLGVLWKRHTLAPFQHEVMACRRDPHRRGRGFVTSRSSTRKVFR